MAKYYHYTPKSRLKSILKTGLKRKPLDHAIAREMVGIPEVVDYVLEGSICLWPNRLLPSDELLMLFHQMERNNGKTKIVLLEVEIDPSQETEFFVPNLRLTSSMGLGHLVIRRRFVMSRKSIPASRIKVIREFDLMGVVYAASKPIQRRNPSSLFRLLGMYKLP